jgi:hypothetical protein
VKDRAKLDALLQMAEIGARHGIAFAQKAEIDPSVLAMIYEKAAQQRAQNDDAAALDSLRNYWRCALLGNVCWQLAHTPKAQPVDLSSLPPGAVNTKPAATDETKTDSTNKNQAVNASPAPSASTNVVVVVNPPGTQTATNQIVTPVPPPAITNTVVSVSPPVAPIATNVVAIPVAPIATNEVATPVAPPAATNTEVAVNPPVAPIATNVVAIPVAPIATNLTNQPAPPPTPVPPVTNASTTNSTSTPIPPTATAASNDTNEMNIPVVPIAKVEDYNGTDTPPATNAAPIGPIPPSNKPDNANGHAGSFP